MTDNQQTYSFHYFYVTAIILVVMDQVTKMLVEQYLTFGHPLSIIETLNFLRLTYITNTGAAWGILEGYNFILVTVALLVSAGCLWVIHTADRFLVKLSSSFILGGGIGNMLDRMFHPYGVVDFIDIGIYRYRWPTFNVADTALVIGIAIYFLFVIKNETIFLENSSPKGDKHGD